MTKKYRIHWFHLSMSRDEFRLEDFLNQLEGEIIAVIPNVTPFPATYVNFVPIVERIAKN